MYLVQINHLNHSSPHHNKDYKARPYHSKLKSKASSPPPGARLTSYAHSHSPKHAARRSSYSSMSSHSASEYVIYILYTP